MLDYPEWTRILANLKSAPKGNRRLDALIAEALGGGVTWVGDRRHIPLTWNPCLRPASRRVPCWTTSFDRALRLVPKDWIVTELCQRVRVETWHWYCALSYLTATMQPFNTRPDAEASTPALAVCAAALQAQRANHIQNRLPIRIASC